MGSLQAWIFLLGVGLLSETSVLTCLDPVSRSQSKSAAQEVARSFGGHLEVVWRSLRGEILLLGLGCDPGISV